MIVQTVSTVYLLYFYISVLLALSLFYVIPFESLSCSVIYLHSIVLSLCISYMLSFTFVSLSHPSDIYPSDIHLYINIYSSHSISYLVDPASSHMLVPKIKPCMC